MNDNSEAHNLGQIQRLLHLAPVTFRPGLPYINFENGSHFICSLNLNNPELTVFVVFRMTNIASGDQDIVNSLIGNNNTKKSIQSS